MDNNAAERSLRNAVTGRKRYYDSGAELAALLFTVLQTVLLWGLNPRHWLTACADNGGRAPADLSAIRALIADNPSCTRATLSRLACEALGWRKADSGLKEMSCSVAMLRMQDDDGLIRLPLPRRKRPQSRLEFTDRKAPQTPVTRPVQQLAPLQFCPLASSTLSRLN